MAPGALVVVGFDIGGRPILHGEGHCLLCDVGTVVPVRTHRRDENSKQSL